MSKSYINLDNSAIEAELYGLFRMVPRKMTCEHTSCGYRPSYSWNAGPGAGKVVKCTFERYVKCTNAELSNPNAKADSIFAAIKVTVVKKGNYEWENMSMIFLYDLVSDTIKDSWFQRGGNESIAQHSGAGQSWAKPSTIQNIKEVVEGMKKNL